MKRFLAAAAGFALCTTAFGDDLLQCVDPYLVRALLLPSATTNEVKITSDVPAEFADLQPPASFEWLGSVQGSSRKLIGYKTALPHGAATDAALALVQRAGWETIDLVPVMRSTFVYPGGAATQSQLPICRDGQSGVVQVRDRVDARYVNVVLQLQDGGAACNRSSAARPTLFGAMQERMPALRLPEGATRAPGAASGMSGSSQRIQAHEEVTTPLGAREFASHLETQLGAQDWVRDASWQGRLGAGSTWLLNGASAESFVGTLEVIEVAPQRLAVRFSMAGRSAD